MPDASERAKRIEQRGIPAIPRGNTLLEALIASLDDQDLELYRIDALRAVAAAVFEQHRRNPVDA